MLLTYEKSFLKDIKKLKDKQQANKLKEILSQLEDTDDLMQFPNVKKLKGFATYYRIKINNYRLGFSYENGEIHVIRFVHRKDIYKVFP